MAVVAEIIGDTAVADWLRGIGIKVEAESRVLVADYAGKLKAAIIERADSLFDIVDYDQKWYVDDQGAEAEVWTDEPQAHRLENGFSGTDSLGRTFHQPPKAHVGPAASQIENEFVAAMDAMIGNVV